MKLLRSICTVVLTTSTATQAFQVAPIRRVAAYMPRTASSQAATGIGHYHHQPTTQMVRHMSASSSSLSPADFAQAEIDNNDVVVFSKSYCPFCKQTKTLLTEKGVDFVVHELNEMDDGDRIQDALADLTGQRTVPNVFVRGQHVGGNSDVQEANGSGQLDEMLAGAATA